MHRNRGHCGETASGACGCDGGVTVDAPSLASAGDDVMIVDYSTTTCGPCQLIAPKYEHMSTLYEDFHFYKAVGVVGDKDCETWELFNDQGVEVVPTFHFYKNGERQSELSGGRLTSIELIDAIEAIRWDD